MEKTYKPEDFDSIDIYIDLDAAIREARKRRIKAEEIQRRIDWVNYMIEKERREMPEEI